MFEHLKCDDNVVAFRGDDRIKFAHVANKIRFERRIKIKRRDIQPQPVAQVPNQHAGTDPDFEHLTRLRASDGLDWYQ